MYTIDKFIQIFTKYYEIRVNILTNNFRVFN